LGCESESQTQTNEVNELLSSDEQTKDQKVNIYKTAIDPDNLKNAFKRIRANASPGLDGYTKATLKGKLESTINKLHSELKKHKYKPSPIKVVHIQKPKGGTRPLGISSVRDKIVQASFKLELDKVYEPMFNKNSFGFRPKLSCHSALKQIKKK